jgi:flagellar motor switch protein FliM
MEKILNHEEIDTLREAAARRKKQPPKEQGRDHAAAACNFRSAGTLTQEHAQLIRSLHDTFARSLTNSLGAYLRGTFEVAVVSVEQIAYSNFLEHTPDQNFVCSVALHPLEALAAVEIDLPLALPVVDMLLGGTGNPVSAVREVTDIEEEVLGSVVQLICRELEVTWGGVLKLEFSFARRLRQSQLIRLMSPKEKVLSVSLEIRTAEVHGMLKLTFPAVVTNVLLKSLDEQAAYCTHTGGPSDNHHFRDLLEQCCFHAELLLPEAAVPARKLMHLKVGEVLEFPFKATLPIPFKVENQILFLAHPVAFGDRRAAEIYTKAATRQPLKEESN